MLLCLDKKGNTESDWSTSSHEELIRGLATRSMAIRHIYFDDRLLYVLIWIVCSNALET